MKKTPVKMWRLLTACVVVAVMVAVVVISHNHQGHPAVITASKAPTAEVATPSVTASVSNDVTAFLRDKLPRRIKGDPLAKGEVDAPVVLTEWADYRCAYCSVWAEETLPKLQPLIDEGLVRIEFRDLAIFGEQSVKAATAARAAGRQGKYFEFQYELFAALPNQGHPDVPDVLVQQIAKKLGLDLKKFAVDWADSELAKAVAADSQEAAALGIEATPAFVVGTQVVQGAQTFELFEELIRSQAGQSR